MRLLVVAGNVTIASSTQITDTALSHLHMAVLVDQQLRQLIEAFPALETLEAAH